MTKLDSRVGRLEAAIDQRTLAIARRPGFPATATEAEQHRVATVAYRRLDRSGLHATPMTRADFDAYLQSSDDDTRALTVGWLKVERVHLRQRAALASVQ